MKKNRGKVLWLAIAVLLAITGAVHADSGAALTREVQASITPDKAIEMLRQGNQRFASGQTTGRDFLAQVKQTSGGQFPFAAIVSCLDSRVPPEIVFDRGIGDLFV
ncbi:MAG: hypothetical protein EOM65_03620, partial [Synergistales bacterium]|nr:hypothetical protein [Synergistales bacterium]